MREVRIVSLPRRAVAVLALALGLALLGGAITAAASGPEQPTEPFFPRSGNRVTTSSTTTSASAISPAAVS
jgi:hypothetical protein